MVFKRLSIIKFDFVSCSSIIIGFIITSIIVCNLTAFDPLNPTADTYTFSLFVVPALEVSGTTTLPKHTIVNAIPITAGETLSLDQEKLVLSDNDRLIAVSNSANKLSITISSLVV